MLTDPAIRPLWRVNTACALLAATLVPVGATLTAGIIFGAVRDFNIGAGAAAGAALAFAGAVLVSLRTSGQSAFGSLPDPSDPDVTEPAGSLPRVGSTVRVRAHFGSRGGYVEHDGLVLWAEPTPGSDRHDLTAGTRCRVEAVDERSVLTVSTNGTSA